VLGNYSKKFRPNPFHTVRVKIGKPMFFKELEGKTPTAMELAAATDRVMREVSALVGELRGERPPEELWDPAKVGQSEIGNYRKQS
jgi:1-acyl-sn-glycerol-3-phosphate acyltransferase